MTLTSIGYGEFTPPANNPTEQFICSALMLLSSMFWARQLVAGPPDEQLGGWPWPQELSPPTDAALVPLRTRQVYITGKACAIAANMDPDATAFHNALDALNLFMKERGLDHRLRVRLRQYYHNSRQMTSANGSNVLLRPALPATPRPRPTSLDLTRPRLISPDLA